MHFHVLGLGSIGRLVSHHLRYTLPPSQSISLIHGSSKHLRDFLIERGGAINIERDGILTKSIGFVSECFGQNMSYSKARGWRVDIPQIESLIVVTKAHQTLTAIESILPRLSPNTTIVLLQNGMGIYEKLIQKFFTNEQYRPHFILCSNTHGAFRKQEDTVVHTGIGKLQLGIVLDPAGRNFEASYRNESVPLYDRTLSLNDIARPDDPDERYHSLRATIAALTSLEELRVSWEPISDIHTAMRRKLVVNIAINTLTALMRCRNGELLQSEAARGFIKKICVEAEKVFVAEHVAEANRWLDKFTKQGLNPDDFNVDRLPIGLTKGSLYDEVLRVAEMTRGNISSMLLDVQAGNETEIEYITGYLLARGRTYGIHLPRIAALHYFIKIRGEIPQDQML